MKERGLVGLQVIPSQTEESYLKVGNEDTVTALFVPPIFVDGARKRGYYPRNQWPDNGKHQLPSNLPIISPSLNHINGSSSLENRNVSPSNNANSLF